VHVRLPQPPNPIVTGLVGLGEVQCLIRVYDKKEFGNNTPNNNKYVITYDNNIFYDCFRLQKFIQGNCKLEYHQNLNTVWGVGSSVDGTDKGKLATEEDAGFAEAETKKELDIHSLNSTMLTTLQA
jgi:opacity protein-like surface antigen